MADPGEPGLALFFYVVGGLYIVSGLRDHLELARTFRLDLDEEQNHAHSL